MVISKDLQGVVLIFTGLFIVSYALGFFILRLLIAAGGFYLVKLGMRMRSVPPTFFSYHEWSRRF